MQFSPKIFVVQKIYASFFCFERAVIWYYFGDTKVTAIFSSIIAISVNQNIISFSQKFKVVINFLNGVVYFRLDNVEAGVEDEFNLPYSDLKS